MDKVIDCSCNVSQFASEIKQSTVETVMRYYNDSNSTRLPTKCLTHDEANALCKVGLKLGVIFEQSGGANGNIGNFSAEMASTHASCALGRAKQIGQPVGSAIYFSVDYDFTSSSDLNAIKAYFDTVSRGLQGHFECGVYGSGTVAQMLLDARSVKFVWLAQSTGWSGTKDMLKTDSWALAQGSTKTWPGGGVGYDTNLIGANWSQFGQFSVPGYLR